MAKPLNTKITMMHYGCNGNIFDNSKEIANQHRHTEINLKEIDYNTYDDYRKNISPFDYTAVPVKKRKHENIKGMTIEYGRNIDKMEINNNRLDLFKLLSV